MAAIISRLCKRLHSFRDVHTLGRTVPPEANMRIDHIAIAVRSLDEQLEAFRTIWDLEPSSVETHESDAVREAMLPVGETRIQLIEATNEDSTIALVSSRVEGRACTTSRSWSTISAPSSTDSAVQAPA